MPSVFKIIFINTKLLPCLLIWSKIISITINVPVRPMPALQWTSIGPTLNEFGPPGEVLPEIDSCLALTSWRKFKTQPGSAGTPWSGHAYK